MRLSFGLALLSPAARRTHSFAKRAIFQATASMLLPSLTIHSIVKYTALFIKKQGIQNIRVRQWLPSALGYVSLSSGALRRARHPRPC